MLNLEEITGYRSKVCPYDPITPLDCFTEKQMTNIQGFDSDQWSSILGLDPYVFRFLKGAEDRQLEVFDLEPPTGSAWYDWVDGPTFTLLQTLDNLDEVWTLECTECIPKETVSLLGDLDSSQLQALSDMSETEFEATRILG